MIDENTTNANSKEAYGPPLKWFSLRGGASLIAAINLFVNGACMAWLIFNNLTIDYFIKLGWNFLLLSCTVFFVGLDPFFNGLLLVGAEKRNISLCMAWLVFNTFIAVAKAFLCLYIMIAHDFLKGMLLGFTILYTAVCINIVHDLIGEMRQFASRYGSNCVEDMHEMTLQHVHVQDLKN